MSDAIETAGLSDVPAGMVDQDAMREQLRSIQAAERRSNAGLARVIGVGESTLSAWIAGTYAGRGDVVAAKVKTWLDGRPVQARLQAAAAGVATTFALTPTAEEVISTLEFAQYVPEIALVAGGAGVGKTFAAVRYKATHRNVWMLTAQPAISTGFAILECLAPMLGVREATQAARSREITRRMCGTQGLLIVDEAQHLVVGAIEQLRAIQDAGGIGLALIGNHSVYARIDGVSRDAQFAQIFSRVGGRLRRDKPYAKDIEMLLDLNEVTDDETRKLLKVIAGKPGALRRMSKTLRVARMMAAAAEADLSAEFVRKAWARVADTSPVDEGSAS